MEQNMEFLCIPVGNKNYAVEFLYIKEVCTDVRLSGVPCLPEHFAGVFHYRGNIVPVLNLEDVKSRAGMQSGEKAVVLVIEHQKYQLGIWLAREPFMVQESELIRVEAFGEDRVPEGEWVEKALYKKGDALFSVADVEKLIEHLIICPA